MFLKPVIGYHACFRKLHIFPAVSMYWTMGQDHTLRSFDRRPLCLSNVLLMDAGQGKEIRWSSSWTRSEAHALGLKMPSNLASQDTADPLNKCEVVEMDYEEVGFELYAESTAPGHDNVAKIPAWLQHI